MTSIISTSLSFSCKSSFKVSVTTTLVSSFSLSFASCIKIQFLREYCLFLSMTLFKSSIFFIYLSCIFFQLIDFFLFLSVISLQFVKHFIVKFHRFIKVSKLAFTFNLVILRHRIHFTNFYFSLDIFHTIDKNMKTLR